MISRALFLTECSLILLLVSVCFVMPVIFGCGLFEIMGTWAPYGFAGGLLVLAFNVIVIVIRLWMMRKNENRKKTN